MLDGILPGDFVINAGAVSMLAGVVWMIFTGRLVTRREADGLKAELEYWRNAFMEEQKQTNELLEVGKVTSATMNALPRPPDQEQS